MSEKQDFKKQAIGLLNRIWPVLGPPASRDLVRVALEVALREAYESGASSARVPVAPSPARASASPRVALSPAARAADCRHDWEEAFLDGRTVGSQCRHCGVLERNAAAACAHYFVKMGAQEVCVGCRASRKA